MPGYVWVKGKNPGASMAGCPDCLGLSGVVPGKPLVSDTTGTVEISQNELVTFQQMPNPPPPPRPLPQSFGYSDFTYLQKVTMASVWKRWVIHLKSGSEICVNRKWKVEIILERWGGRDSKW